MPFLPKRLFPTSKVRPYRHRLHLVSPGDGDELPTDRVRSKTSIHFGRVVAKVPSMCVTGDGGGRRDKGPFYT